MTLLINTYSYNTNGNKGVTIGLQMVLFDDTYKDRTSVAMNSEYLSGHGITVIAAPAEEEPDQEEPAKPAQESAQPAPTSFGYAPQQSGQFAQPVQPQQPAQFAQPVQPAPVQPAPSQFAQPVQPQPGQFAQPVPARVARSSGTTRPGRHHLRRQQVAFYGHGAWRHG